MRLIDADALKNLPFNRMIHTDFGDTAIPIEEIDNSPTVEPDTELKKQIETYKNAYRIISDAFEDEVRKNHRPQGKWLNKEVNSFLKIYGQCSNCLQIERVGNFCRNCGADMRGNNNG